MSSDALDRLTDRERAYLRLVEQGLSSKEIALKFGNGPKSVDKAILSAMGKLGTSSRVLAAQFLTDFERGKLPPQPQSLADPTLSPIIAQSDQDTDWEHLPGLLEPLREDRQVFETGNTGQWVRLPIRRHKGDRNDLNTWARIGWVAVIAVGIPLLLGSLTVGLWALEHIYLTLQH